MPRGSGEGAGDLIVNPSEHPRPIILGDLMSTLKQATDQGISFCSWKSNLHLNAGLAGETDIDVLVAPDHTERLASILRANGCLRIAPPPGGDHPGMSHFIGMDRETRRIFHLHVHDRLVLGQRFSKNHVLPLTEHFLHSARSHSGIPQPEPALELVVLTVRALLKYRVRDAVKDVLGIRTPGVPDAILDEIDWCLERSSQEELTKALAACAEIVPVEVVETFLNIIRSDPRSGLRLWRVKAALEARLAPYRRRSKARSLLIYILGLARSRFGLRRDPRLRLNAKGTSIAVVGADGAGKTTISLELSSWVGEKLAVSRYYMGSKEPSLGTTASYLVFRMFRKAHRDAGKLTSEAAVTRRALAWLRDVMLATHHLSVARDRLRRLRKLKKDIADGQVVLLDRYPLEWIGNTPRLRLLDGPSIQTTRQGAVGRLADAERSLYQRFTPPDAFLLLEVDPDVAIARKPDHDPVVVGEKVEGLVELERLMQSLRHRAMLMRIDSNRPWPEPLEQAQKSVWQVLSERAGL